MQKQKKTSHKFTTTFTQKTQVFYNTVGDKTQRQMKIKRIWQDLFFEESRRVPDEGSPIQLILI